MNEEGKKLYSKWEKIYEDELQLIRAMLNDDDYTEGWCIIDDYDHVKTIEDEIGLLVFGYDDYLPHQIEEWESLYGENETFFTDIYGKNYTVKEIKERAMVYYNETDSND